MHCQGKFVRHLLRSFRGVAHGQQKLGEVKPHIGREIGRLRGEGLIKADGLFRLASSLVCAKKIGCSCRLCWVESMRAFKLPHCFRQFAERQEDGAVSAMSSSDGWRKSDDPGEGGSGFWKIVLLHGGVAGTEGLIGRMIPSLRCGRCLSRQAERREQHPQKQNGSASASTQMPRMGAQAWPSLHRRLLGKAAEVDTKMCCSVEAGAGKAALPTEKRCQYTQGSERGVMLRLLDVPGVPHGKSRRWRDGRVRLNAADSKSAVLERVPGVRIPLSPPDSHSATSANVRKPN